MRRIVTAVSPSASLPADRRPLRDLGDKRFVGPTLVDQAGEQRRLLRAVCSAGGGHLRPLVPLQHGAGGQEQGCLSNVFANVVKKRLGDFIHGISLVAVEVFFNIPPRSENVPPPPLPSKLRICRAWAAKVLPLEADLDVP